MLSAAVVSALAFSPTTQLAGSRVRVAVDPMMLGRRDALFAGVVAAAMPMAALADGSTGIPTLQKARLTYGQRVLALSDASPSAILDEAKAIKLYVSAVERSKGRKVDPRSGAANKILAAAKAGDKAGANAAIKELAASTKLTKYVDSGVVSGSKFVDASGLVSGVLMPDFK